MKFYSSVRVDVRRIGAIKDGDKVVGNRTRIKMVKNKVAAPFREAEVDLIHGIGISREADLVDAGVQHSIVAKSGTWFSYKGERLGQGRENAKAFLQEHTDLRDRLDAELRKAMDLTPVEASEAPPKPVSSEQSRAAAAQVRSA